MRWRGKCLSRPSWTPYTAPQAIPASALSPGSPLWRSSTLTRMQRCDLICVQGEKVAVGPSSLRGLCTLGTTRLSAPARDYRVERKRG